MIEYLKTHALEVHVTLWFVLATIFALYCCQLFKEMNEEAMKFESSEQTQIEDSWGNTVDESLDS